MLEAVGMAYGQDHTVALVIGEQGQEQRQGGSRSPRQQRLSYIETVQVPGSEIGQDGQAENHRNGGDEKAEKNHE